MAGVLVLPLLPLLLLFQVALVTNTAIYNTLRLLVVWAAHGVNIEVGGE